MAAAPAKATISGSRHSPQDGVVAGLDVVPAALRPPVTLVHLAFDLIVGIGFALLALGGWLAWSWWRRWEMPATAWFLRAVAIAGVGATVAMEAGWVTTEVGRQPWIVYQLMTVSEAINPAPGLRYGLYAVLVVYTLLTVATVAVLRRLARRSVPVAPQESDVEEYSVI